MATSSCDSCGREIDDALDDYQAWEVERHGQGAGRAGEGGTVAPWFWTYCSIRCLRRGAREIHWAMRLAAYLRRLTARLRSRRA